jgi:rare lipoprotein A
MRRVSFRPWILTALLLAGCASEPQPPPSRRPAPSRGASGGESAPIDTQHGLATWYSDSLAGRHTASGEPYNPRALTAAHRTLPFGTRVRVARTDTGHSVEVVVNDRGPFGNARRIIDLSRSAAEVLRMLRAGVVPVRVEVLELGQGRRRRR